MGEAPHEVYTDVEKKARAEKVCGNCKWWLLWNVPDYQVKGWGSCTNKKTMSRTNATLQAAYKDFGCIHYETKQHE